MYRVTTRSFLVLILFALLSTAGLGQRGRNVHGFQQTYPGAIAIGVSVGPNLNMGTSGPASACECDFDGGSGLGYHAGLHLDILVNRYFGIRLQGLFEDHSTVYESERAVSVYSEDGALVPVTARRRDETDLQYVGTGFMVTWFTGPEGLYLLTGAGAGFFVGGNIRDEEYLLTPGYVFPSTGSSRVVLRDEALDAREDPSIRAGLILGVGYDIPLGRGTAVAPELQLDYPLTSVVDANADWTIPTLRASLTLRFGL